MTILKQIINLTIGLGVTVVFIVIIVGSAFWLAKKFGKNG